MNTKTFYAYTPQDFKYVTIQDTRNPTEKVEKLIPYGERATIAVAIQGNYVVYGIAICDETDIFNKQVGRDIAYDRMNGNFGRIPVSNFKFKQAVTPEQVALHVLNTITNSVYNNYGKFKNKIKKFNYVTTKAHKAPNKSSRAKKSTKKVVIETTPVLHEPIDIA